MFVVNVHGTAWLYSFRSQRPIYRKLEISPSLKSEIHDKGMWNNYGGWIPWHRSYIIWIHNSVPILQIVTASTRIVHVFDPLRAAVFDPTDSDLRRSLLLNLFHLANLFKCKFILKICNSGFFRKYIYNLFHISSIKPLILVLFMSIGYCEMMEIWELTHFIYL